ncbi:hypothetical protein BH11CYA1_BH11CYA1_13510 [soil metagenome]
MTSAAQTKKSITVNARTGVASKIICIGLLVAAFSNLSIAALFAQTKSANIAPVAITLEFFKDISVGRLILLKSKWNANKDQASGRPLAAARGTVKVLANQPIMLIANDSIGQKMAFLSSLPSDALACLILNDTSISSGDLARVSHLNGLRRLELFGTDIDDTGVQHLSKLSNLSVLYLGSSLVKGNTLDQLTAVHLHNLQLDNLILSPKAFRAIAKFKELRWLSVARAHANNAELAEIAHMPMLEELMLGENIDISDLGIKRLVGLKRLSRLNVSNTSVTPDGLIALKGLDLKVLKISSRYKNDQVKLKLHQAFPRARLEFDNDRPRIPLEMFAPLH